MSDSIYLEGLQRQLAGFRERRARGMRRVGWKIGINVPEVQRRAGLTGSLVGFLAGERVFESGAAVALPAGSRLHVEPELCLSLRTHVARDASVAEARAAIAHVQPALEIVDYSLPRTDLTTTIAHSMFHYGIVLGAPRSLPSVSELESLVPKLVFAAGAASSTARADLVPGELALLVLRAAQILAEVDEALEPGDLLMCGSFTDAALPLAKGETARASFGELGAVECRLG